MTLLGASCLAPWKAYLSAVDFFNTTYERNVEYAFGAANMLPLFVVNVVMTLVAARLPLLGRVYGSLGVLAVTLMSPVAIDVALHREWLSLSNAYALTLASLGVNAAVVGVLQSSLYGLAGMLSPSATQALQLGKGIVGVSIIALRAITKLAMPTQLRLSSYIFFGLCELLVVAGVLMMARMMSRPFTRMQLRLDGDGDDAVVSVSGNVPAVRSMNSDAAAEKQPLLAAARGSPASSTARMSFADAVRDAVDAEKARAGGGSARTEQPRLAFLLSVYRQVFPAAFTVFLVFVVCIGLFPGVSTALSGRGPFSADWMPILAIAAFDVGDLIGKSAPGKLPLLTTPRRLVLPVLLHLCFVPLFLFNVNARLASVLTVVFRTQAYALVIVGLLGVSTGYIGCSACMMGPSLVPKRAEDAMQRKESAGFLTTLSLITGLTVGSLLGLVLERFVD